MEPPAEAAHGVHCLVQPKEEVADDLGITYDCEEDIKAVTVKEEWCDISVQLDSAVCEQDCHMRGQDVVMVMPIKTELTLSDDLARLHTQHQLAEYGSVPQMLKVEWKPKAEADVAVDCASTCVAPLSVKFATNRENKWQTEEADTVQKSELLLEICNGTPDKRSFDTKSRTSLSEANFSNIDTSENCFRTRTSQKYYYCELCKYKSLHDYLLLRHMKTHTGEKSYVCELCHNSFARKSHLASHMRTHTAEQPICCDRCDSRYTRKSNLVIHMRTHTGEKPYVCELCDYRFARKDHLVSHMRTHTGEKPFCCDLCDYRCARKTDLVVHITSHTGDKRYICKLCHHKSATKSKLLCHMRTHTGVKPYICDLCNYRSAGKSNLVSHIRIHTGEKPYLCKLCKYRSARKPALVRHMRSYHTSRRSLRRTRQLEKNYGNKVQAEEADTVQKSEQVLEIYNGEPDKRSFDTSGVTNTNSLANCVAKSSCF